MHKRGYLWLLALLCLMCLGCGGQTASGPSTVQRILGAAPLHDAAFTITFTTDSAHGTGTGTLTMDPALVALHLNGNQHIIIDTPDDLIYGRLANDPLWSILNDVDNGVFTNYDVQVWQPGALQAPQLVGTETLDGSPTWHVRGGFVATMYDSTGNIVDAPGTEDVWLRQSDSLPVQLVKKAHLKGTSSTGLAFAVDLDATYHFTAWNRGATITLPDPSQIAASG
ncbi:MAG: hypothetical protein H0X24_17725 [Ktedonobacterales bacterium]|nr:hypothetical protein [Ktedonobacterales bacterium]